jgi:hypothetical protein
MMACHFNNIFSMKNFRNMKTTLEFRIQNLLEIQGGTVSGPMSPMLFAKEMSAHTETKFNRLARVWFDDEKIFQRREDGGFTGFDTLIIGQQYSNDLRLELWVDEGVGGMPVAIVFQSVKEINISPIYHQAKYARKLSKDQIKEIFEYVFNNPQLLAIPEEIEEASDKDK